MTLREACAFEKPSRVPGRGDPNMIAQLVNCVVRKSAKALDS